MPDIQIVTDSCAHFPNQHILQQQPITVVPFTITLGGESFCEGVDISNEEALRLIAQERYAPVVTAPTVADYYASYDRLVRHCDAIISIHASRSVYSSWHNARTAAQQMAGHCPIVVIDSQTLSVAQALLIRSALKIVERGGEFEEIERMVRGMVERSYSIYHVEQTDYLMQNRIIAPSHAILGSMLGLKPLLSLENGQLSPTEKVKTRIQAVERLVEFAIEFTEIDEIVILQSKPFANEQTRMVQERLAVEFPGRHFAHTTYGASLAALVGTETLGLVVVESELDRFDNDI